MTPPPLTTCRRRDSPAFNNARVESEAAGTLIEDDAIEHTFQNLSQIYTPPHIRFYDATALGFRATAQRLAQEIPTEFPVASYLDLGAGTGITTIACAKCLIQLRQEFEVVLIDGLRAMLDQALENWHNEIPQTALRNSISAFHDDIFNFSPRILSQISTDCGFTTFSLITAERVLLNVRKNQRVQILRYWATYLSPGGKLILDIPHPGRRCGATYIGAGSVSPGVHRAPTLEVCRTMVDEDTWVECRAYAQELARDTGLIITNQMPQHLPESGCEDDYPAFLSWLAGCRAPTLNDPLTRAQLTWFTNRYVEAACGHYKANSFLCCADIAAVIAVLERPPPMTTKIPDPPVSALQSHTKYKIDETRHGKDRKKAIKQAAKAERKAAAWEKRD